MRFVPGLRARSQTDANKREHWLCKHLACRPSILLFTLLTLVSTPDRMLPYDELPYRCSLLPPPGDPFLLAAPLVVPWLVPGLLLLPVPWLLDVLPCDVPGRLFLLLLVLSPYMVTVSNNFTTQLKELPYKSLLLLEWWPIGMLRSLIDGGACFDAPPLTHELLLVLCCCCE